MCTLSCGVLWRSLVEILGAQQAHGYVCSASDKLIWRTHPSQTKPPTHLKPKKFPFGKNGILN